MEHCDTAHPDSRTWWLGPRMKMVRTWNTSASAAAVTSPLSSHHAGVQLLEAVGRGGAAVAVASVRADDGARGRGELRGGGQPAAQLPVELRAVARVPAVGVRGSPHRHPAAGRGGESGEVTRGHCGHLAVPRMVS